MEGVCTMTAVLDIIFTQKERACKRRPKHKTGYGEE
jgi:hypothetical protein